MTADLSRQFTRWCDPRVCAVRKFGSIGIASGRSAPNCQDPGLPRPKLSTIILELAPRSTELRSSGKGTHGSETLHQLVGNDISAATTSGVDHMAARPAATGSSYVAKAALTVDPL